MLTTQHGDHHIIFSSYVPFDFRSTQDQLGIAPDMAI